MSCDSRYDTFVIKKRKKHYIEDLIFKNLKKLKKLLENLKRGLKRSKTLFFFKLLKKYFKKKLSKIQQQQKSCFFPGAFIWNHPLVTFGPTSFMAPFQF